jgi:hypothetical protein
MSPSKGNALVDPLGIGDFTPWGCGVIRLGMVGAETMMDWTAFTDEKVFSKVGEQAGSQASYERDIEIKRRLYFLERNLLVAQLASVDEQRKATAETSKQSKYLFWSTMVAAASAVAAFATAFVTYYGAH